MQINNINNINSVIFNNHSTDNKTKKTNIIIPEKTIELPDIRSNQILLPQNRMYVPGGLKPADFNTRNISVAVPENYRPVHSEFTREYLDAKLAFKKAAVRQYFDTKTQDNIIRITKNNYNKQTVLNSVEITEVSSKNPEEGIKYVRDFEHNTETEIKLKNPLDRRPMIYEKTTIYKDENGKVFKTEKYTLSPYIEGVYDITETDAEGNEKIVAKTTKNKDGSIFVERNLESLDGTKTTYRYKSDAEGHHKSLFCQITDKDGKILSTIDRSYDKENDKVTTSSVNGHQYTITKNDDGITISDHTKAQDTEIKKTRFDNQEAMETLKLLDPSGRRQISAEPVTEKLFDTLPADTLLTLQNNIKAIIPLEDDLDSAFVGVFDYLLCKDDNFVINHELGHSKDSPRNDDGNLLTINAKNVFADETEFRKTYMEEKAAFIKAFPDFEEKFISYFIFSPASKPQRGRKETVAESNAINGLQSVGPAELSVRTIVLQKYFPRSIALLTNMMNPVAIAENQQNNENQN